MINNESLLIYFEESGGKNFNHRGIAYVTGCFCTNSDKISATGITAEAAFAIIAATTVVTA